MDELIRAINSTGVAEVVEFSDSEKSVRIIHRVNKSDKLKWRGIVEKVLSGGVRAHFGMFYFLGSGGSLKYAWEIILKWDNGNRDNTIEAVTRLIRGTAVVKTAPDLELGGVKELSSYPLACTSESRNVPGGPLNIRASGYSQKGAHFVKHA